MDFETKLAAAGDVLEKLAAERGLNVADFTEQEVSDLLTTIMGEDGGDKTAYEAAPAAPSTPAAPAKTASAAAPAAPQLTYGQVMAEVVKVASANGYDITQATPEELDDAVQKMATLLTTPGYLEKQAALQEKIAEADAMGRIMAHSYVDELGKIAAKVAEESKDEKKKEEDEKEEKKASLVRALRKTAGEMPEAFKKKHDKDEHEKGESKEKEEAEEKKAAFAKQASLLAAERLIIAGINPTTGTKFASEQEQLAAASDLILAQKGYL